MIDGLQVFIKNPVVFKRLRLMTGAVEHTSMDTGEVLSHSLDYDVFKVKIKDGVIPSATIKGSLHRFYCDGHNDTLFTFRQVRKAVEKLAWLFCINLRQPCLQNMEFGVNIPTQSPEALIDAAVLYYSRGPTKDIRRKEEYYKYWEFEDYVIKLYRKGSTLVRFEIRVRSMSWLSDIQIRTLEDLRRQVIFVKLIHKLLYCAGLFLFVPTRNETIPSEMREEWASLRDLSHWGNLRPWKKTRKQKWVREIVNQYGLVDWNAYLKKGIKLLGTQMLEIEEAALNAMFSALGLQAETVAGPLGNCNRQARIKKDVHSASSLSNVSLKLTVANGGMSHTLEGVWLSCDVQWEARGPPSLVSFILTLMYLYNVALLMPVVSRMWFYRLFSVDNNSPVLTQ